VYQLTGALNLLGHKQKSTGLSVGIYILNMELKDCDALQYFKFKYTYFFWYFLDVVFMYLMQTLDLF